MEKDLDAARDEFIALHDRYLDAWDHACRSGEHTEVAAFAHDRFRSITSADGSGTPAIQEREEAARGLKLLVRAMHGATHRAQNRVIRLRSAEEAVVFYERVFGKDDKVLSRFLVTQIWCGTVGGWRLLRESLEVLPGEK